MRHIFSRSIAVAAFLLMRLAQAGTPAEACLVVDQTWTPPTGLTAVKRLIAVGGGAAGGADGSGNFGAAGKNEPVGGATAGTSWGAGGAAGIGAGGGGAGFVLDQANVAVSGPVTITVGKPGTTAGAAGGQSCFGSNCADGGTGGSAYNDFSPVGGGQAGWAGTNGTSAKTAPTQEIGSVTVGASSSPKTITVENNSGASSTFLTIAPPTDVTIVNDTCSGKTVAKGANCTFDVQITSSTVGDFSASINVTTQRGKLVVPLHATVTQPPSGSTLFLKSSTFTVPAGVYSVSAVCVGGGTGGGGRTDGGGWAGEGGGGGALAYKNDIQVTPGQQISVVVGLGGAGGPESGIGSSGGASSFGGWFTAGGGNAQNGGTASGSPTAWYAGGKGSAPGSHDSAGNGGGSAGYTENGGDGAPHNGKSGGGGGVSLYGGSTGGQGGQGNGVGGTGGSGGTAGGSGGAVGGQGGTYGGGGGGGATNQQGTGGKGGDGACRVIWGPGRAFPSSNSGIVGTESVYK